MIQQPATNQLPPGLHQTTGGRVVGVPLEAGTFHVVSGTLPDGYSLDAATGSLVFTVTDSVSVTAETPPTGLTLTSNPFSGTRITLIIAPPPTRWERIRAAWDGILERFHLTKPTP